jgi:hypothetical protein
MYSEQNITAFIQWSKLFYIFAVNCSGTTLARLEHLLPAYKEKHAFQTLDINGNAESTDHLSQMKEALVLM